MLDLIIERSPGNFQGSGVEAGTAVTEVIARLAAPLPAVGTKTQKGKTEGENEASIRREHMIPGRCHWRVYVAGRDEVDLDRF